MSKKFLHIITNDVDKSLKFNKKSNNSKRGYRTLENIISIIRNIDDADKIVADIVSELSDKFHNDEMADNEILAVDLRGKWMAIEEVIRSYLQNGYDETLELVSYNLDDLGSSDNCFICYAYNEGESHIAEDETHLEEDFDIMDYCERYEISYDEITEYVNRTNRLCKDIKAVWKEFITYTKKSIKV